MSLPSVTAYIGLGSNVGDVVSNVRRAISRLRRMPETSTGLQSSLYLTAPIDSIGNDFVNAVVQIHTHLKAEELLKELMDIEQEFGRTRPFENAPRAMDLDILLYGRQQIETDNLVVPHPKLTERAFTLMPLLELDPLVEIPGQGLANKFVAAVSGQRISKIWR